MSSISKTDISNLVDQIYDSIAIVTNSSKSISLTDQQIDSLLSTMISTCYKLVYVLYNLKRRGIPVFSNENIGKIRIAYKNDKEAETSDKLAMNFTNMLNVLKLIDKDMADTICSLVH